MKVAVHWIILLVILCSWKGVQLGLLPLPRGLLFCTRRDVLIAVAAFCSCTACRFLRHSGLVELVGMLVGLLVGAPLLGTLGTGVCVSMEPVILLLTLIWGVGTLGDGCTLGTRCVWGLAEGVALSSKHSGHA